MSIAAALGEAGSATPHAAPRVKSRSRGWVPLLAPGLGYLVLFFVLPVGALLATSLYVPVPGGDVGQYQPALEFSNYTDALAQFWPQLLRSFAFALIATVAALIIGYPMAYAIAVRAPCASLAATSRLLLSSWSSGTHSETRPMRSASSPSSASQVSR